MASEKLIIELDAKTSKLDSKLKSTENRMDRLDDSTKRVDHSLSKIGKAAVASAAIAGAAIASLSIASARWARELEVASVRAGETVERMQALAFASNTVGISIEKLGDISKDTNEKIGEFMATGGGGFVDFIDVMRIGKAEARELAAEFQTMSGPAVLQEMVRQMEAAGISSNQMSFALEGVASDATDLIPLLRDNAKGLNDLTEEFVALGAVLTQEEIDKIKKVGEEFNKLGQTFSSEGRQLVAEYSNEIITLIEWLSAAGTTFINFADVVAVGFGNIIEIGKAAFADLTEGSDTFAETVEERMALAAEKVEKLLGKSNKALEIHITKGTKAAKGEVKQDSLTYDQKLTNLQGYVNAAQILNSALFGDNKLVAAGLIVADTATAIMKSLSINPFDYGNVAVLAATGLVQLSNALGASKGGGSTSSASGGSSSGLTPQQPDFQPETSSLELSDSTEGGSQSINITVPDGDEIGQAIANWLTKAQSEGRA